MSRRARNAGFWTKAALDSKSCRCPSIPTLVPEMAAKSVPTSESGHWLSHAIFGTRARPAHDAPREARRTAPGVPNSATIGCFTHP